MSDRGPPVPHHPGFWDKLLKFWPVLLLVGSAVLGAYAFGIKSMYDIDRVDDRITSELKTVNTRIAALAESDETNSRQWKRLTEHGEKLKELEIEQKHIRERLASMSQQLDRIEWAVTRERAGEDRVR